MKVIWKFPLEVTDFQVIQMPMFAKILHLNTQRDIPCLWAECDSDAEKRPRYYRIYGTGHPMLDGSDCYIGSFDMQNGALVFHVYESLSGRPLCGT